MSHYRLLCPIWGTPESTLDNEQIAQIGDSGRLFYSHRAGGRFELMESGALQIHHLTDKQKANLSYWIYQHSFQNRLFDESSIGKPPVLNDKWVGQHQDRTPSSSDRMLAFLCEAIRSKDARYPTHRDLLEAAGGCFLGDHYRELLHYAVEKGWLSGPRAKLITLSGRIHVEQQLGKLGHERQGFVAMWFDECMDKAYECGIRPAIEAAGYIPRRIDEKEFVGPVVDEIVAEIRKSKFVLPDLTTSPEAGDRGGVYFEAGFAYGLGIPVFLTCRKDRAEGLHFDIDHINRLEWGNPEDLRKNLRLRIEAVLGHGPARMTNEDRG